MFTSCLCWTYLPSFRIRSLLSYQIYRGYLKQSSSACICSIWNSRFLLNFHLCFLIEVNSTSPTHHWSPKALGSSSSSHFPSFPQSSTESFFTFAFKIHLPSTPAWLYPGFHHCPFPGQPRQPPRGAHCPQSHLFHLLQLPCVLMEGSSSLSRHLRNLHFPV